MNSVKSWGGGGLQTRPDQDKISDEPGNCGKRGQGFLVWTGKLIPSHQTNLGNGDQAEMESHQPGRQFNAKSFLF